MHNTSEKAVEHINPSFLCIARVYLIARVYHSLFNLFLMSFSALFAYYEKNWYKHSCIGIFVDNAQKRAILGTYFFWIHT